MFKLKIKNRKKLKGNIYSMCFLFGLVLLILLINKTISPIFTIVVDVILLSIMTAVSNLSYFMFDVVNEDFKELTTSKKLIENKPQIPILVLNGSGLYELLTTSK